MGIRFAVLAASLLLASGLAPAQTPITAPPADNSDNAPIARASQEPQSDVGWVRLNELGAGDRIKIVLADGKVVKCYFVKAEATQLLCGNHRKLAGKQPRIILREDVNSIWRTSYPRDAASNGFDSGWQTVTKVVVVTVCVIAGLGIGSLLGPAGALEGGLIGAGFAIGAFELDRAFTRSTAVRVEELLYRRPATLMAPQN